MLLVFTQLLCLPIECYGTVTFYYSFSVIFSVLLSYLNDSMEVTYVGFLCTASILFIMKKKSS